MKTKYIWLLAAFIGFTACEDDDMITPVDPVVSLTPGSADFSKYVAVGASFTAGYTDGALFNIAQENSFPNMLATQFSLVGGGAFNQPMMSGNLGGLAVNGTRIASPRLVFGGAGPVPIESLIGPQTVATDLLSSPSGPFNNFGVPGAKSFHLIAPGFGSFANFPAAANPYAVRLTGSTPDASILQLAMDQSPTFFTLSEIGGNDVLGYATTGGDGTNPITPTAMFDYALNILVNGLTAGGAKGAIGNVPYITSLSHFTTVPHNPLSPTNPDFGPQIPVLNATFAGLNAAFDYLQMPERKIVFATDAASAVLIHDESLPNIAATLSQVLQAGPNGLDPVTAGIFANQFGQSRQATADDLLVLPSQNAIATLNEEYFNQLVGAGVPPATAGQLSVNGITYPLRDKWVLLPTEQEEIITATDAYNNSIATVASAKGLALVDLKALLEQAATTGVAFDKYTNMTTSLVTGGLVSLDGIHLTARGNGLMSNAFLDAIDATYGSNFRAADAVAKAPSLPTNYSPTLQ